jgi:hypothetical protein
MSRIILGGCKLCCRKFALWSFVHTAHCAADQSSPVPVIGRTYAIHSFVINMSYTYLLTPWSTVLLEKLTGFQLVKKFPTFYGTPQFVTTFTIAATWPYPSRPITSRSLFFIPLWRLVWGVLCTQYNHLPPLLCCLPTSDSIRSYNISEDM